MQQNPSAMAKGVPGAGEEGRGSSGGVRRKGRDCLGYYRGFLRTKRTLCGLFSFLPHLKAAQIPSPHFCSLHHQHLHIFLYLLDCQQGGQSWFEGTRIRMGAGQKAREIPLPLEAERAGVTAAVLGPAGTSWHPFTRPLIPQRQ